MLVQTERVDDVMVVWIDNPPVNALSHGVRAGIMDAIAKVEKDDAVRAAVLICKGRTFIAGADVREFNAPAKEPKVTDYVAAMEKATKPWVAAIHGTALGGGFETALGCHYRIALPGAKIGLPEVNLGIIPGAGGTVRIPHLVSWDAAIDMVTSGRHVPAKEALDWGAIDKIVDGDLLDGAIAFARDAASRPLPPAVKDRPLPPAPEASFWENWEAKLAKKAKGQRSPLSALQSVRNACEMAFEEAYAAEREIFIGLRDSDQGRAMRHAFFAERAVGKIPALKGVEARSVSTVAVIGGGTMGAGIAAAFINAELPVTMVERDAEALDRGLANVRKIFDAALKRGLIDAEGLSRREGMLHGTTDLSDIAEADLVVEAVFEDMDVKRDIFTRLDATMKQGAILATNTSYLDIDEIAAAVKRPGDVVGLHFFSPAHIMKLLEIVKADATLPDVLATCFDVAKKLRKIGVLSGVCDGFIGNRILRIYRRQADYLLEDGCLPQDVDAAMRAFGMPMGPYEAQDLGGLDIAWANRKRQASGRPDEERYVAIADRLCELGRFGQKTGKGWYAYADGDRTPRLDPEVEKIILEEAAAKGITRRSFDEAEIQRRILLPMINEGIAIVEEGIAQRPLDIDMVEIHGYGFPRWRGGLMQYADEIGLKTVLEGLQTLAQEDAYAYRANDLLKRLVGEGKTLASLNEA